MTANEIPECSVHGASTFDPKNPPHYVFLPRLSPEFMKVYGDLPLECILNHNGDLFLRPEFQSDCEIVVAEQKTPKNARRVFVTAIQLRHEKLTQWL